MSTINPHGKQIVSVSTTLCGKTLTIETGRVGFRTSSSVIVRYGDTVVLGTAMVSNRSVQGMDYFPLSIDYEEKFYAAGKISGSRFVKREGRPSDEAILIGRLIDRPIRPLWPKGYRHEVQGVATVLSMDPTFRPDMIAMIAVSTAFMLSGAPFDGPVAGLRVGMQTDGSLAAFLPNERYIEGDLDLVVAGTDGAIMMVEAGAREVSEDQIIEAISFAQEQMQPALDLQRELVEKLGVEPLAYELVKPEDSIQESVDAWVEGKLGAALRAPYPERNELISQLREQFKQHMAEQFVAQQLEASDGTVSEEVVSQKAQSDYLKLHPEYEEAFTRAVHADVRRGIVEEQIRPDGRSFNEIRPLSSEISILPRAHGSSLFTRGMTQALNITTLASLSYAQLLDTMEHNDDSKRFMHHYNAPGYTVGEVRRLGSPGRREIGHSALAERALLPVIPSEDEFPYTIRSVTEIMSQNGSTSMAATCSMTLSLMNAGVPIARPVSGIAMGLIMDGDKPYILSDIADAEDFAGDMDFKVTGTERGITALQMDMKVHGLPVEVLRQALTQGREGRMAILEHMLTTIAAPSASLSPYAPRIEKIRVKVEKIGAIIGKGGEMINKITSETGAEIDIKDDGLVTIASPDADSINKAINWIKSLVEEPEVGKIYEGRVVKVMDFGAFVNIMPGIDGMVHISQLSDARVEQVTDVVKEGDTVRVKLTAVDERGRLNLTMRDI